MSVNEYATVAAQVLPVLVVAWAVEHRTSDKTYDARQRVGILTWTASWAIFGEVIALRCVVTGRENHAATLSITAALGALTFALLFALFADFIADAVRDMSARERTGWALSFAPIALGLVALGLKSWG